MWNKPKCSSVGTWLNKLCDGHTMQLFNRKVVCGLLSSNSNYYCYISNKVFNMYTIFVISIPLKEIYICTKELE